MTESDGGADAATEEEFYELLRLSMDGYSCAGARGGYIYFAKQVSTEIADVIAASPTPGVVKLYVLMDDGTPATEEMKERVLAACSADDVRPLTDFVSVEDPENVDYRIRFTYYTQRDNPISAEALETAVRDKVKEYTAWQCAKLGRDINPEELVDRVRKTGHIKRLDLKFPAYRVLRNGLEKPSDEEDPLVYMAPQVARLGTVTLTNGGVEDE